jgi:hypothetical protein
MCLPHPAESEQPGVEKNHCSRSGLYQWIKPMADLFDRMIARDKGCAVSRKKKRRAKVFD